jgi:phosphate ABC transporter phosphate-binding protein
MKRVTLVSAIAAAVLVTSIGCTKREPTLNMGGATSIYPMMDKWSVEYQKAKGIKINYNSIGSSSGIRQMIDHTLDLACSDAPMDSKQLQEANDKNGPVVHIPLVLGAVVPSYHLDNVQQTLNFAGPVLADIYLGKITRWNDSAIKQDNPGVELPDLPILVARRGDASATTQLFTEYLAKVSPQWRAEVGSGTSVSFPVGISGKG